MNAQLQAQPEQRNADWYAQRIGRITASRVGAILGLGKFQSRDDVLRTMIREALGAESEFTGNEATEYGSLHEADALAEYEKLRGVMIEPCALCVHPQHDWLAASPDGFVGERGAVECKAPYRARYTEPSAEYCAQMQLQMACADRDWCDFAVWRDGEPLSVTRVECDENWLPRVLPTLRAFMDEYRAIIADPEAAAPYLAPKERTDAQWARAAQEYRDAEAAVREAEARKDDALAALRVLAPDGGKGCGVALAKVERAGSVDYARACKQLLPDFDFEPFRKSGTTYYSVRVEK